MKKTATQSNWFDNFATGVSKAAGSSLAFAVAFGVVLVWAISGPFF